MVDKSVEAINKALLIVMSSSVLLETMFVPRLFADGKLTVVYATLLGNKVRGEVARLCRVSDMGLSLALSAVKLVTDASCCHGHVVTLIRPL